MSKRSEKDYEVGYRKTPPGSRWKPGQSGNPRGRKKGSKNKPTTMAEAFAQELAKQVPVTIDGKREMVDVNRYIAMRFVRLMCGAKELADIKRGAQIAEMLDVAGAQERLIQEFEYQQLEDSNPDTFTEEDRRVLEIVRNMMANDYGDDASPSDQPRDESFVRDDGKPPPDVSG